MDTGGGFHWDFRPSASGDSCPRPSAWGSGFGCATIICMPNPKLPNVECYECPEGNQFMEHRQTRQERVSQVGLAEEFDYIAIFRCSKNPRHSAREEAFDPKAPG